MLRKDLLAQVEVIVVDEADRMLDLGFEPQLRKIFKSTGLAVTEGTKPKKSKSKATAVGRKQANGFRCWFFSASWPATADKLARAIANSHVADPNSETTETATPDDQFVYVEVGHERKTTRTSLKDEKAVQEDCDLIAAAADTDAGTESSPASTSASSCRQEFVIFEADKRGFTKSEEKLDRLVQIITAHPGERILVFCNMKKTVTWLQEKLLEKLNETVPPEGGAKTWNRMSVRGMHSDLSQEKRCDTYLKFKTNKFKILVATDIAARGLNIVGLNLVVNFDSAEQGEDHLHRIGRCGRGAGLVRKAKTGAHADTTSTGSGVKKEVSVLEPRAITFLGSKDSKQAKEILQWTCGSVVATEQEGLERDTSDDQFGPLRALANAAASRGASTSGGGKNKRKCAAAAAGEGGDASAGSAAKSARLTRTAKRLRNERHNASGFSDDQQPQNSWREGEAAFAERKSKKRKTDCAVKHEAAVEKAEGKQAQQDQVTGADADRVPHAQSINAPNPPQGQSSSAKRRARRKQNLMQQRNADGAAVADENIK